MTHGRGIRLQTDYIFQEFIGTHLKDFSIQGKENKLNINWNCEELFEQIFNDLESGYAIHGF